MIPDIASEWMDGTLLEEQPSHTYAMNDQHNRITGTCDGLEAMRQAIYKILNTERYECPIYSWNYGVECKELYGKPMSYCVPEIERRITEALLQDDRIRKVTDFQFSFPDKNSIHTSFTVLTTKGTIPSERTVRV